MITFVDPPEGWRYGFPKPYPHGNDYSKLREWFLSEGYPEKDIELALKYSWYREQLDG